MNSLNIAKQFGTLSLRCIRDKQNALGNLFMTQKFHRCCVFASDATLTTPQASNADKQFPAKIQSIVSDISKLTLLEVAELNQLLKKTLNIPDAPMMAMGAVAVGAAASAEKDDDESSAAKMKTSFTAKLARFDDTKKIQLIKEVKNIMEGMNLVQAKKFVESAPQVLKADISKVEAESLQKTLEAVGAVVVIE